MKSFVCLINLRFVSMLKWKKLKRIFWKTFLWFNLISIALVLLYRFVPVPYTITMFTRSLQSDTGINKKWVTYDEVSPFVPLAIIAAEDQKFPSHHGFDFDGMKDAFEANQNGGVIRGGSTISQQVAKNVFLWQHKSYIRKGLEVYYTALVELFWPKKRILEVYMNVAETGKNTFGVEEGAQRYFNKSAKDLSQSEAARLIQVLPSPQKYSSKYNNRTKHIVKQMNNLEIDYLKKID